MRHCNVDVVSNRKLLACLGTFSSGCGSAEVKVNGETAEG